MSSTRSKKLEELLQDLSGSAKGENQSPGIKYPIGGDSFMDLRSHVEDFQKRVAHDIEEGRGRVRGMHELLQRLEAAKHVVDKIRENHEEKDFFMYIDRSLKGRKDFFTYLENIKKGAANIESAKLSYRRLLRDHYIHLKAIVMSTENCEVPDEIQVLAQQHSCRLAFNNAKRSKLKTRKNNPTPAQIILEQLVRASPEGKATDDLKAMVGSPARTYTLKDLVVKGVLCRMNEKIPKHVLPKIQFSFQFIDEGFRVQALVGTTLLKDFAIDREEIGLLESARKNATLPFGDGFMYLSSSHLRRLLAWIAAEGGL